MKAFKNERAENRITLFYEMNRNSPVFARVAASEMGKGNFEAASEILENGIFHFPDYSTAYFLYAKVLAKLGKSEEAQYNLNKANNILGNEETYNEYLKIIENPDLYLNDSEEPESRGAAFIPDEYSALTDDQIKTDIDEELKEGSAILDELENLAKELENAKMPPADEGKVASDESLDDETNSGIITETMANIYLGQGNREEAISVYEQLIQLHPEKESYFKIRIEEIRQADTE